MLVERWTEACGLFEVAVDADKHVDDLTGGDKLAEAISQTALDTVVGKVARGPDKVPDFARKNIAKTPLVGVHWRRKEDGFDLVIVENGNAGDIPLGAKPELPG